MGFFHLAKIFLSLIVNQSLTPLKRKPVFSIDGAFVWTTSESPDISTQNSTKVNWKGHGRELYSEKMTSGHSEVAV